jgi:hypothetical protein
MEKKKILRMQCREIKMKKKEVKGTKNLIGKTPVDWTYVSPTFFRQMEESRRKSLRRECGELKEKRNRLKELMVWLDW